MHVSVGSHWEVILIHNIVEHVSRFIPSQSPSAFLPIFLMPTLQTALFLPHHGISRIIASITVPCPRSLPRITLIALSTLSCIWPHNKSFPGWSFHQVSALPRLQILCVRRSHHETEMCQTLFHRADLGCADRIKCSMMPVVVWRVWSCLCFATKDGDAVERSEI
ncbi:hypothetical protein EX30DRAFT_117652 [Ascodesmis nigricans]|uniref:Uncharacterized protein n=1 Tax=Ascodesmis nigricans TaxID=341454 RepID=A0A4S2MS03_9PEZI|nr:hypothetical protein EX30DRAFT_117652 [Ascodesmis nigricans]